MSEEKTIKELLEEQEAQKQETSLSSLIGNKEEAVEKSEEPVGDVVVDDNDDVLAPMDDGSNFIPQKSKGSLEKFVSEGMDAKIEEAKADAEERERVARIEAETKAKEEQKTSAFKDVVVDEPKEESVQESVDNSNLNALRLKKVDNNSADKNTTRLFSDVLKKKKNKAFRTKVVLPNSGYSASIIGLSSPEMRNYNDTLSGLDLFGQLEFKYKTLFEKIVETSIGEMDFDTFLKRTALLEYEILNYGLFSSTFPEKSTYPWRCAKCGSETQFTYENKAYLDTHENDSEKKAEVLAAMRKVLKGEAINAKELFDDSETANNYRVLLKDSKIIVELRHPTLYDQLYDTVANTDQQLIENNEALINLMPFISAVYFPTNEEVENVPVEQLEYLKLTTVSDKINALNIVDDADDDALSSAIEKNILSKYVITFTMRPPKCPNCGNVPEPEPINFETMLFMTRQIRMSTRNS